MTTSALAHLSSVLDDPNASLATLVEAMKKVTASDEPFDWHPWMERALAHGSVNDVVVAGLMDAPGVGPWMVAQPRVVTMIGQASQPVLISAVQAVHAALVRVLASEGPRTVLKVFLGEVNRRRSDHLLGYNTETLGHDRAPDDLSYGYPGDANYRLVPYRIFLNELVQHALEAGTSLRLAALLNAHRFRERLASYGVRPSRDEAGTLLNQLWEEPSDDARIARLRALFLAPLRPERIRAAIERSLAHDTLAERLSFFAHLDALFRSLSESDRASPRWRWARNAIDHYYLLTEHDRLLLADLARVPHWQSEAVSDEEFATLLRKEEMGERVTVAMTALSMNPNLTTAQMLALSEADSGYYAHLVIENPALPISLLTDGIDQELLHNVLVSVKDDFFAYIAHVTSKVEPEAFFDEYHDALMMPFEEGRASVGKAHFSATIADLQKRFTHDRTFLRADFAQFFEWVDYLDEVAMMVAVARAFKEADFPSWDSISHTALVAFHESVACKEREPS